MGGVYGGSAPLGARAQPMVRRDPLLAACRGGAAESKATFAPRTLGRIRMPNRSPSKQRLEELIALARTYRGWSSKDLARELGRDTHHLVPNSGVPKLDIVVALAEALDWTVQDVVDDLYGNVPSATREKPTETWAELDRAAWEALQKGEYSKAASIARREFFAATNGQERAMACIRECGAWDGVGRYLVAMECCQRGLSHADRASGEAYSLRNNLANSHYLLGNFEEAAGIASRNADAIERGEYSFTDRDAALGFALYVRGSVVRASLAEGIKCASSEIAGARADLKRAAVLLRKSATEHDVDLYAEQAATCDGALLAATALAGDTSTDETIDQFLAFLDLVVDVGRLPTISAAETVGWWCVFGAEVAANQIRDQKRREQTIAIFTNKADEVASISSNWAHRERIWAMELLHRTSQLEQAAEPWVIDEDDARELSGAMARFPRFRKIGWQIFRSARIGGA